MTFHQIRLGTSDGQTVSFSCAEDETVVEAAARAELAIPTLCGAGNCGTCRGQCKEGAIEFGAYHPQALSDADRARGTILMCRTYPRSDLEVTVPFARSALNSVVAVRRAEIVAIDDCGGFVRRLRLCLLPDEDGCREACFEPGQFMELTTPDGGVTRAYSLANAPNWTGDLEFFIRLQSGGRFSTWLAEAAVGEVLTVRGPLGDFTLKDTGFKPRWFAGGGTGFAPLLSMLRRMAEWQEPHPARLYLGVTTEDELFAAQELEEIEAQLPGLIVERCVWKPGAAWKGFAGTPVDAIARDLAAAETQPDIYLCGPPGFVSRAQDAAEAAGLPPEAVFSERFMPA